MFTSIIKDRSSSSSNRSRRDVMNQVVVSIRKGGKTGRRQAVFYIGANITKKARLIKQDRVDILISDCGKFGLIKRVNQGGRCLSSQNGNKSTIDPSAYCVTITGNENLNHIEKLTVLENVKVEDDGIFFDWPVK